MKSLTPAQAAVELGLSVPSVYRLIEAGRLAATGEGYGRRITPEALKSYRVRDCPTCGKPFMAKHGRQTYGSDLCRYTAGNQRKAERKPAQPAPKKPAVKIDMSNQRLAAALKHVKNKTTPTMP